MRLSVNTGEKYKLRVAGQQNVLARISAPINVQIVDVDIYDGAYEVIPAEYEQTLQTRNKKMMDDVVVREVPFDLATYAQIDRLF